MKATGTGQFFVGMSFLRPIYYVATEDIFSMGFLSKLIRFLVAPIPIKKQTTDIGQSNRGCPAPLAEQTGYELSLHTRKHKNFKRSAILHRA